MIGVIATAALGFAVASSEGETVAPFVEVSDSEYVEVSDSEYDLVHMVGDRRFEATLYNHPFGDGNWGWAVREADPDGKAIRQFKNKGRGLSLQEARIEALWSLEVLTNPDVAWDSIKDKLRFMSMLGEAPFEWGENRTLMHQRKQGIYLVPTPIGRIFVAPFGTEPSLVCSSSFAIYYEGHPTMPSGFTTLGEEEARRLLLVLAYRYLAGES